MIRSIIYVCFWSSLFAGVFFLFAGCEKGETVSPGGTTGTGGSMARFTILGNYLYTVDNENLKVFDISNVSSPQFIKTVAIGFEIETIYPFKDKLFVGSRSAVYFFSVADPANPVQVSEAIEPSIIRRCDPVVAKDTVAFATLNTGGPCGGAQSKLVVYNIKDFARPVKMAEKDLFTPYGLGYKDTVLYVCDYGHGLRIFNISDAWNPVEVKTITDNYLFKDVIPYGDILICWTYFGLAIYNIEDPLNPVGITQIL